MTYKLLTAVLFFAAILSADPVIAFGPSGPNITAFPGAVAGWDISVTPDAAYWVSITDTQLIGETNPIGFYTDLLGPFGGPTDYAFAPGGSVYTGLFDAIAGTGLGSYAIDPATAIGTSDQVQIEIDYYLTDGDPITCTGCSVVGSGSAFLTGTVTATPEPGALLSLAGLGLLVLLRRPRRPRSRGRPRP